MTSRSPKRAGRCSPSSIRPTGSRKPKWRRKSAPCYFLKARTSKGRLIDSVARFHLGNGARLERINWLGDLSTKGLRESAGIMVNYLYRLEDIEKNHEAYANDGEVVASSAVKKLLRNEGRRLLDMRLGEPSPSFRLGPK